jgi:hypothetical protein
VFDEVEAEVRQLSQAQKSKILLIHATRILQFSRHRPARHQRQSRQRLNIIFKPLTSKPTHLKHR